MQARHLVAILFIMALFGSAYPVGKLGVGHFPPFEFAALRSTVLTLALLPLWRFAHPQKGQGWALVGFCASMGVGVYATMYTALGMADTVSPIVIGTQLSIPFAVVLGRLVLGERVRPLTWGAIVAAFAGVLLIAFEPALARDLPALGVIAASAFCYATATLFARSLRSVSPFVMNGWMAASAILPLALLSVVFETGQWQAIRSAGPVAWGVVLHSALAVSLLAHVGMFSLYRHYPVAHVIPYYVLMPVFGVAFTLLLFEEVPSTRTLFGGAIVILATWVVNRSTAGSGRKPRVGAQPATEVPEPPPGPTTTPPPETEPPRTESRAP
ncbi:DMT family transporter [Halofilum ochraceum]|uniref:DMT family transporter n=1 Tax=Halofilum ochraceum TaxID=1611323 RepID=UPI00082AE951|nr:DMT family transporter [Halofilum ochraceum]